MLVLYDIDPYKYPMAFPPLEYAWGQDSPAPGLLARGGDLSIERLVLAYSQGIFPWFSEGEPILWWSLDPRLVLYPQEFKFSRSLKKTLKAFLSVPGCEIKVDTHFEQVIKNCALSERNGQDGTWISPQIIKAYTQLHEQGFAHSFETWVNGELVGGLYGVNLGGMFYGESMFFKQKDASKLALCGLMAFARAAGIKLIDCQQETAHLKSLGARSISRSLFADEMKQAIQKDVPFWVVGTLPNTYWKKLGL